MHFDLDNISVRLMLRLSITIADDFLVNHELGIYRIKVSCIMINVGITSRHAALINGTSLYSVYSEASTRKLQNLEYVLFCFTIMTTYKIQPNIL